MSSNNTRTILLVDDEENITRSIKRVLRPHGYHILIAKSAEEALLLLSEYEDVQVIVSDQRMPKMTGSELFERVQELYPNIIRILLTGYTAVEGITSAVNKGAVYRILFKPWDDDHLVATIKDALRTYDVIEQNKLLTVQLQEFNKNLESLVEKKTRELTLNVKRLHISHRLFDNLPSFAMGISDDGYVVEANLKAQLAFGGRPLIGAKADEVIPRELLNLLERSSKNQQEDSLNLSFGEINYQFSCSKFEINKDSFAYLIYGIVSHV